MSHKSAIFRMLCLFVLLPWVLSAGISFSAYHAPDQVDAILKNLAREHHHAVRLVELAKTPGNRPVVLVEIGGEPEGKEKTRPAILVTANPEGNRPVATEAALMLIETLIQDPDRYANHTWYVVPQLNPDAASRFFTRPRYEDSGNMRPHNDDMDDQVDEDGPEDLDGNGIITAMRVKHPAGRRVILTDENRLMKEADWKNGEVGVYRLYPEGIDNDGDGEINEDAPGGVNVGINFPHLFPFFTSRAGAWAGSADESYYLMKFVFEHPRIAMSMVYGATNFCLVPPRGGRRGSADFNNIKIPERIAGMLHVDPDKTYTMAEVMEMAQKVVPPGMELTESMVASFLGLGAVVNPLPEDLAFYQKLSEDFKEFLKKKDLSAERFEPPRARDGSLELWAYYHLGIPSFSMDFWSLPKPEKEKSEDTLTPEQLEKMTNEEFIALGEERINAFLKASGAPAQMKADRIIQALEGGMLTTKRMAAMMKQMGAGKKDTKGADEREKAYLAFNDQVLEGRGFVPWKPYSHPTLGEVEIGGFVPYLDKNPPKALLEKTLRGALPWVFELVGHLPVIRFHQTEVTTLGEGVYRITAWVENRGMLPYPTAMGQRNERILPVIVTLEDPGVKILEGKRRMSVKSLPGYGRGSVEWVVFCKKARILTLKAITNIAGTDLTRVDLRSAK